MCIYFFTSILAFENLKSQLLTNSNGKFFYFYLFFVFLIWVFGGMAFCRTACICRTVFCRAVGCEWCWHPRRASWVSIISIANKYQCFSFTTNVFFINESQKKLCMYQLLQNKDYEFYSIVVSYFCGDYFFCRRFSD